MKSIKVTLSVLLGTLLSTCQKGAILPNVDLKGDWEQHLESFECPCHMIYIKKDTTCHLNGSATEKFKIIGQNDSLFFEYFDGVTLRYFNIQAIDKGYKRGDKLWYFKNTDLDPFNNPPRYATTEATIVNENLINYKIYYYDDVTKTGAYGLIRYSGVQEVNLRRIKKK